LCNGCNQKLDWSQTFAEAIAEYLANPPGVEGFTTYREWLDYRVGLQEGTPLRSSDGTFLTLPEAAAALGVHTNTLRKWISDQPPPEDVAVKLNNSRWRFYADRIWPWVLGRQNCPSP
jgi:hypothetical protein